jgi:hypothetical protein
MTLASEKVASRSATPRLRRHQLTYGQVCPVSRCLNLAHDLRFRGDRCYTTWWGTIQSLGDGEAEECKVREPRWAAIPPEFLISSSLFTSSCGGQGAQISRHRSILDVLPRSRAARRHP